MKSLWKNIINTKNNINDIKKLLNLLINYTEILQKILLLIKMNTNLYVIYLLNVLVKQNMNLLYKHE